VLGAVILQYFCGVTEELGEYGMLTDPSKPIPRVGGVGFHSVDDAMPVTSFNGVYVLGNIVALSPASNTKQQAG
jgi:hypothetical protein